MTFKRILCAIGLHGGPVESSRIWRKGRFGTEYHFHCCNRTRYVAEDNR